MLYTFECKKCEKVEDRLVRMAEAESQSCSCGEHMDQIDTFSSTVLFKGRWFKTAGSY